MAAVSFQSINPAQEAATENNGQQGATTQAAANTNQNAAAPQDSVTISHLPPAEFRIPILTPLVPISQFPGYANDAGAGTGQNNTAANNGAPVQPPPPTLPPNPPINLNAAQAPAVTAQAINPPATDDTAAITGAATSQTQLTPDQQLVQLDQTLQQLGIDPQSISLFNRMALLVYAQDPTALQNLVQALQATDQQLGQLTGLANPNGTQAQLQPPAQAAQNVAQQLAQTQTPAQVQAQPQSQDTADGNNFEIVAAQLNFTEVQGTLATAAPANDSNGSGATQAVQTTAQFQELQLSFAALEIQGGQNAPNDAPDTNTNAQGQTLNVTA